MGHYLFTVSLLFLRFVNYPDNNKAHIIITQLNHSLKPSGSQPKCVVELFCRSKTLLLTNLWNRNLHVVNTHPTHVITPNIICAEPPEDERVMPETCRGIDSW
jgi:hypothetical protein